MTKTLTTNPVSTSELVRLSPLRRSLDGRPVHAAMVVLSEHYWAVLADHLTSRLGLTWQQRDRGADRNACWDLTGVPDKLRELSSRRGRRRSVWPTTT